MKQASLIALLLAACAIAGFVSYRLFMAPPPAAAVAGDRLPSFVLATTDGGHRNIADFLGKPLVLNFWATWCPPCLREIPLLVDLHRRHGEHIQVVGVAIDRIEPVRSFIDQLDVDYPVLIGEQDAMLAAGAFGDAFVGLPFTVFAAADGQILGIHIGEIHAPEMRPIEATLLRLARGELTAEQARRQLGHADAAQR